MTRAPIADLAPGKRTLARETSSYLCRVLRLARGDRFIAFDAHARTEAEVTIEEASAEGALVTIGEVRPARVIANVPLVLVYALAKGDKVDTVVRDATELGATRIVVAPTARSVVKIEGTRGDARTERWRRIAEQAARQSGRADPPTIDLAPSWKAALDVASSLAEARFILEPRADNALGAAIAGATELRSGIAFAVGPEGGLTSEEVADARAVGFSPVSIGPFVLRTETVAAAVLGAVRILSEK